MADPKYANLRGIAHDQPDCYETDDLPEADQNRDEIEEESEFIEKININVPNAFSKFKDKTLIGDGVDFSDRLGRRRRTGYYARSGDWELAGEGEKETPLQRYERLKIEFKELVEDLTAVKEPGDKKEVQVIATHVSTMLNQLESLKLEQLPESESVNLTDPQRIHMRKLLNELEKEAAKPSETKGNLKPGEGRVVYSVLARPDQASAQISARIALLEQKLNNIYAVLPPSDAKNSQVLGERSLLEMAREVESQALMLMPSQLEAADSRVSSLLTKMDKLKESKESTPAPLSEAETKKVIELYEFYKSCGEISDSLLPQVIDRLTTLEYIHQQAQDFTKSKTGYEKLQSSLKNDFETTKKLLSKVEDHLNQNMTTLKTTAEKLDSKMESLSKLTSKGKNK